MNKRIFALWLACAAVAAADGPQLHGSIAGKHGPADARQWTFSIAADGQTAVPGVVIQSVQVAPAADAACRPSVKSPARFPLAVGDLPVGGSLTSSVTLDFSGCPNPARFTVEVRFAGNGGAAGVLQRRNEYR